MPKSDAAHAHEFEYREIDGETWNVCACGFRELWASGLLISTTDEAESERLEAATAHLHDPPGAGWSE